jgi:hypothetical protein
MMLGELRSLLPMLPDISRPLGREVGRRPLGRHGLADREKCSYAGRLNEGGGRVMGCMKGMNVACFCTRRNQEGMEGY